jgi:hypothetical protein
MFSGGTMFDIIPFAAGIIIARPTIKFMRV